MSNRPGLARGGQRVALTRLILRERDGDRCGRCGELIDFARGGMDPAGPTLGHIIPAVDGGSDELANLRLEHRACNLSAGARPTPPRASLAQPVGIE